MRQEGEEQQEEGIKLKVLTPEIGRRCHLAVSRGSCDRCLSPFAELAPELPNKNTNNPPLLPISSSHTAHPGDSRGSDKAAYSSTFGAIWGCFCV